MQAELDAIRQDQEPLRKALAMVRAVQRFLDDLDDDEPGDDEARFGPRLEHAQGKASELVHALRRLTARRM